MHETSPPLHICIGTPRSGTTWLYNNLYNSDRIFLPCVKEIRYWWGGRSETEKNQALIRKREMLRGSPVQLAWLDRWEQTDVISGPAYRNLMGQAGLPSLDISPIYNTMPREQIAELRAALPETSRVFAILRNPLERNSSAVRMHGYMHGWHRGTMADSTMEAFMNRWFQQRHQDYVKTVQLWRAAFGDRFGIFYYDDLKKDPEGFLQRIGRFLGLTGPISASTEIAGTIYNSDRGLSTELYFPAITSSQKRWLAALSLSAARAYAEIDPEMSARWCNAIRAEVGEVSAGGPVPDANPVDGLLRMTENLGETCDFALFQRSRGYEPTSLLRWSQTPLAAVAGLLNDPGPGGSYAETGMGSQAGTLTFRPDLAEQTRFREPQTPLAGIEALQALVERFTFHLYQKPCLYVVTTPTGLSPEQQQTLLGRLRHYNSRHRLLHVSNGPDMRWQRGPEGVYQAQIPLREDGCALKAWENLFENLVEQDDIRNMIDRMFV